MTATETVNQAGRDGQTDLRVTNPATGKLVATLHAATAGEVAEAAERAQRVFESGVWSGLSPRERAAVLLRLADL